MSEHCVCCGKEIPEGRQVCPVCESGKRNNMPYLKPCPFCGGKASLFSFEQPDGSITYEVDCENEGCEVSACTAMHDTPEEAAAVWNKRGGCRCQAISGDDEKRFSGLIEEE